MPKYLTLDEVDVRGKVVLVRVDFNSPLDPQTKRVSDDTRIRAHGEATIRELSEKGARVVVLAHQGRQGDPDFTSLKQHAEILRKVLGRPVQFVEDVFGEKAQGRIKTLRDGDVLVLDNVRKYARETEKGTPETHAKTEFVQNLAPLADLFVNDAFAAAHRAHVSIVGFTQKLRSVVGRIMERELSSLSRIVDHPEKPCVFILGGAKADDALEISRYVLDKGIADYVLTGGVAGHVFLVAKGFDLGPPNMEFLRSKQLLSYVSGIRHLMEKYSDKIKVPLDIAVEANALRRELDVTQLPTKYLILDIGTRTVQAYAEIIGHARSIVISGPLGVYENSNFVLGTKEIFGQAANSGAFTLAGGGHTIAALQELGLSKKISYISTAGGALIEFLMGKDLPGVMALKMQ